VVVWDFFHQQYFPYQHIAVDDILPLILIPPQTFVAKEEKPPEDMGGLFHSIWAVYNDKTAEVTSSQTRV